MCNHVFAQKDWSGSVVLHKVSGESVAFQDVVKQPHVVLCFISRACAFSNLYEERLIRWKSSLANKPVQFLFVISTPIGTEAEDSPANVGKWLQGKSFSGDVFFDFHTIMAAQLQVNRTPAAVVLSKSENVWKSMYSGAIDDNPSGANHATDSYLLQAIDEVLAGKKSVQKNERPFGCAILKK